MSSVVKKEILHHAALILIQAFCAVVFMTDAISDIMKNGEHYTHLAIEFITSTALIVAIVLETRKLMELLQRHATLERTLENASQAVHVVIENKFVEWSLTPSERDVCQRRSKIGPLGGAKVDHLARGERCRQEGQRPVSRAHRRLADDWPLWPARANPGGCGLLGLG